MLDMLIDPRCLTILKPTPQWPCCAQMQVTICNMTKVFWPWLLMSTPLHAHKHYFTSLTHLQWNRTTACFKVVYSMNPICIVQIENNKLKKKKSLNKWQLTLQRMGLKSATTERPWSWRTPPEDSLEEMENIPSF